MAAWTLGFLKRRLGRVKRLVKATGYSLMGLKAAWGSEPAFRLEVILFVILAPIGVWLGQTGLERAVLVGSLFLVLIAELVNSGLEAAIDRVGEETHPLSKKAKDVGSAAVFVSLANVIGTWMLIIL